jgi:hypothetical protein
MYLGRSKGVLVREDLSALTGGGELSAGDSSISCGEENSRILAATPLVGDGVCQASTPKDGKMSQQEVVVGPPPPARFLIRFNFGLETLSRTK